MATSTGFDGPGHGASRHTPKTKTRDFGQGWSEWVVGQILMREAKGLLNQKPAEQTQ
jgi:hypothetical protein